MLINVLPRKDQSTLWSTDICLRIFFQQLKRLNWLCGFSHFVNKLWVGTVFPLDFIHGQAFFPQRFFRKSVCLITSKNTHTSGLKARTPPILGLSWEFCKDTKGVFHSHRNKNRIYRFTFVRSQKRKGNSSWECQQSQHKAGVLSPPLGLGKPRLLSSPAQSQIQPCFCSSVRLSRSNS